MTRTDTSHVLCTSCDPPNTRKQQILGTSFAPANSVVRSSARRVQNNWVPNCESETIPTPHRISLVDAEDELLDSVFLLPLKVFSLPNKSNYTQKSQHHAPSKVNIQAADNKTRVVVVLQQLPVQSLKEFLLFNRTRGKSQMNIHLDRVVHGVRLSRIPKTHPRTRHMLPDSIFHMGSASNRL